MDEAASELEGFFETGENAHLLQVLTAIGNEVSLDIEEFKELPLPAPSKGFILEDYFDADA